MTELPGLPPFGAEPAFTADDAAYGAVALRARNRRRTQLAAVSAAAALVVAVATVSGPGAYDRVGLEPTDDAPTATTTAPPTGDPTPTPSGTPGSGPGYVVSTEDPPGSTPAPPASGSPAEPSPGDGDHGDGDGPHVVSDCVDADGNFVACDSEPRPRGTLDPEWRETWQFVDDRVTEECAPSPPGEGWCFRFLGPVDTTAGTETTFTAELCRQPNGRDEPVIHFQYGEDDELAVVLIGEAGEDGTVEHVALSYTERREAPHSRTIASGRCLRWTVTWNGVGDDGRVLPPGAYTLSLMTNGHTPRTPLPGEADRADKRAHGDSFIEFRIR